MSITRDAVTRTESVTRALPPRVKAQSAAHRLRLYGLSVFLLTAGFLGISGALVFLTPSLFDVYDIWFGTDIPRHVQWAIIPAFVFRSHLHPLSFAVYKTLGALLRLLHVHTRIAVFLACSLPPALMASGAIVFAAARLARPGLRPLAGLAGVVLGSTLFYAGVPESHTMGGAALLVEGILVFLALRLWRQPETVPLATRHAWGAVIAATMATGMSISNAMPGLILLSSLFISRPARRSLARPVAFGALVVVALEMIANLAEQHSKLTGASNSLSVERAWLAWPTWASFRESLSSLFLHLFGLPACHLTIHKLSWPDQPAYALIYPRMHPSLLQCLAAGCWIMGLVLWWRRTPSWSPERMVIAACLTALLSLVAFSTVYDTFEAYMVSAHAWPFVLLPALLVLSDRWKHRDAAPARCMIAAVLLSALQTALVLPHVFSLLVHL